jgi:hypothetical protein
MQKYTSKKITSAVLITAMMNGMLNPTFVHAGDPCQSAERGPTTDTTCSGKKMAKNGRDMEIAKAVFFGTAAATAYVLAAIKMVPYASQVATATCNVMSIAVPIAGLAMDAAVKKENKSTLSTSMSFASAAAGSIHGIKELKGTFGKTGSLAKAKATQNGLNQAATDTAAEAAKEGATKATKQAADDAAKKAAEKTADHAEVCVMTGIAMTLSSGTSALSASSLGKTYKDLGAILAGMGTTGMYVADLVGNPPPEYNPGKGNQPGTMGGPQSNNGNTPNATEPPTDVEVCRSGAGDYLACLGRSDATFQAVSASQELRREMDRAVGGNFSDFMRKAPNDLAAVPAYISNAMGLGEKGTKEIESMMEKSKKIAQESGLGNAVASAAPALPKSSAGGPAEPEMDFNKMLADMMKALGVPPEEADDPAKREAALESTFRRIELLPPEKVEANRDISLFVRVGFRYRKNLPHMDQLAWSSESNQRSPANSR